MANNVIFNFKLLGNFARAGEKIARKTKKMTEGFKKFRAESKAAGKQFKKTGSAISGQFKRMAAAAVGFFGVSKFLSIGSEFQDAMADLSAITGATGDDFDKLKRKTLAMAKATVTSQAQIAEGIKLVGSAKPELLDNLDALVAVTEQVLLLKNASGIDLASAAIITAQGLNIFGESADQAGRFVNVLAAGAKLGSSEIADTGEAMLLAGPAARAAGLSFEQLNAAIQTVAKGGIKGSQAGTALNAIFGRLRRRGDDFKKLGLPGVFKSVAKELNRVRNPTRRAQLESKIFGEEHSKVGLAILNNIDLLAGFEVSLKGTNIAQEQASIRMNTFSTRLRLLGIILAEKVIKLFERLEPVLSANAASLGEFIDQLSPKQIDQFADKIASVVEGFRNMGVTISNAIAPFRIMFGLITGMADSLGQLVAALVTLDFGQFKVDAGPAELRQIKQDALSAAALDTFRNQNASFAASLNNTFSGGGSSVTDINVNIRAPERAIESVKSKTTGKVSGLNVGLNMSTAL